MSIVLFLCWGVVALCFASSNTNLSVEMYVEMFEIVEYGTMARSF
jgi:hypothetical protein